MNYKNDQEYESLYLSIYKRQKIGCFKVHAVFDCYLVSLRDHTIERFLDVGQSEWDLNMDDDQLINYKAISSSYFKILLHFAHFAHN
jgi:hypothetical protein